jgi:hypothetical protein
MIFGRLEDRPDQPASMPRQTAAVVAGRGESIATSRVDVAGRAGNGSRLPEPPQIERCRGRIFSEPDAD